VEDKQFKLIVEKLDTLIRIMALSGTKEMTSSEKIALLHKAGISSKDIAEIIGTSQNVVNVRLSQMRKKEGKDGEEKGN
jgi:DNA-binding CsgD family transcriptional regulator